MIIKNYSKGTYQSDYKFNLVEGDLHYPKGLLNYCVFRPPGPTT
jgi:hypothetical protein